MIMMTPPEARVFRQCFQAKPSCSLGVRPEGEIPCSGEIRRAVDSSRHAMKQQLRESRRLNFRPTTNGNEVTLICEILSSKERLCPMKRLFSGFLLLPLPT